MDKDFVKMIQQESLKIDRFLTKKEVLNVIPLEDIILNYKSYPKFEEKVKRQFTKEELIDILKNKAREIGRTPHNTEMNVPMAIVFINQFGSWENALKESDLEYYELPKSIDIKPYSDPIYKYDYSNQFLIDQIKKIADNIQSIPRIVDMHNDYLVRIIMRKFGSWNNAIKTANLSYAKIPHKNSNINKYYKGHDWYENIGKIKMKNDKTSTNTLQETIIDNIIRQVGNFSSKDNNELNEDLEEKIDKELIKRLNIEIKRLRSKQVSVFRKYRNIHFIPSDIFYINRFNMPWNELIKKYIKKDEVLIKNKCKIDGCKNSIYKEELCRIHYLKILKHNDAQFTMHKPYKGELCSVENCNNLAKTRGFCQKHYLKFQKYGDASINNKIGRKNNYELYEKINQLRTEGKTFQEIGEIFGVSKQTIQEKYKKILMKKRKNE